MRTTASHAAFRIFMYCCILRSIQPAHPWARSASRSTRRRSWQDVIELATRDGDTGGNKAKGKAKAAPRATKTPSKKVCRSIPPKLPPGIKPAKVTVDEMSALTQMRALFARVCRAGALLATAGRCGVAGDRPARCSLGCCPAAGWSLASTRLSCVLSCRCSAGTSWGVTGVPP